MSTRAYVASAIVLAFFVASAIAIGSYSSGLYPSAENKIAVWDLVIKGVGGALALSGALIAVYRYLDDRSKAIEASLLEARKPFLERRQAIYVDLIEATATIGSIEDYAEPISVLAERRFWAVYWGTLPLVTDEAVSRLVDEFSELLADHNHEWVRLRNLSMGIARACRASMGFDPPLPPPGDVTVWESARPGS